MRSVSMIAFAAIAASSFAFTARAQSLADAPAQSVKAVWKVQSFDFEYGGDSTTYSCSALSKRVRSILKRLGAHESIVVSAQRCYDLSELATLRITLATPVEATPENVYALAEYDSKDALIARVRGEALASAEDMPRFTAEWQTISLAKDKRLKLPPGDCELVQQLQRSVFPRLEVRVVDDRLRCSRAFGNYVRPQLTVAALVAKPDERAARLASRGEVLARN